MEACCRSPEDRRGVLWMAGPAEVPGVDPSRVNTPNDLATCLEVLRLRRGLSYEAMEKAAARLLVPIGQVTAGAAA
jgi:hypothetical protein